MPSIQIRNVPKDVHRRARARAALQGLSLSEYALQALERELGTPTMVEIVARIRTLEPVDSEAPAALIVREQRDRG